MKLRYIGILFILFTANCSTNSTESTDTDDPADSQDPIGPAKFNPEIILGAPVSGVEINDSQQQIIDKLGDPTSIAQFSGNRILIKYADSLQFNLTVDDATNQSALAITSIESSYQGKSGSGLGIGSLRSAVIAELGSPNNTFENGNLTSDRYTFPDVELSLSYETNSTTLLRSFQYRRLDN